MTEQRPTNVDVWTKRLALLASLVGLVISLVGFIRGDFCLAIAIVLMVVWLGCLYFAFASKRSDFSASGKVHRYPKAYRWALLGSALLPILAIAAWEWESTRSVVVVVCCGIPASTPTFTSTASPTASTTPTSTITPSSTPSATMTATPSPASSVIDAMDSQSGWNTLFCDAKCGGPNGPSLIDRSLIPGRTDRNSDNAIEISYTVKSGGWVEIERDITPNILSGITGISFYEKNSSVPYYPNAPNTIEVKLTLRYPGDKDETAFGVLSTTDIGREWVLIQAPFSAFKCMFPAANCLKHSELVPAYALRFSFAISNKPEFNGVAGSGKVAFDDVRGIRP